MSTRRPAAALALAVGLVVIAGGTAGLLLTRHSTPAAAGRMTGVEWRASSRPAVPPAITTRPAASASAAAGLRVDIG